MAWQRVSLRAVRCSCSFVASQTVNRVYVVHCTELENRATKALDGGQSETIVGAERQLLADCSELMSKKEQASTLRTIGMELVDQRQYDDAIPILQRCGAIYPDRAGCWVFLGDANWELKRRSDAKTCWERAVAIGGFDDANAHAIQAAKRLCLNTPASSRTLDRKAKSLPTNLAAVRQPTVSEQDSS